MTDRQTSKKRNDYPEEISFGDLTSQGARELLMVSESYLRKLTKLGHIKKSARDRWDLVKLVQGYISFLRDEDRKTSKSAAYSRLTDIKAERLEMQLRAERAELVDIGEIHFMLDTASTLLHSKMMDVPAKLTRDPVERQRLEDILSATLQEISDGIGKKVRALERGEDVYE